MYLRTLHVFSFVVAIVQHHLSLSFVFVKGIHVEELKQETNFEELINCVIKELNESSKTYDENTHKFPKKYLTGIEFHQVWQTMAQFVMECIFFSFTLIKSNVSCHFFFWGPEK